MSNICGLAVAKRRFCHIINILESIDRTERAAVSIGTMRVHMEGTLSGGYLGHISYYLALREPCRNLWIRLQYRRDQLKTRTASQTEAIAGALAQNLGRSPQPAEVDRAAASMKTELSLAVFLDGRFIGGCHRPGGELVLRFAPGYATQGGCPQNELQGVLRVNIIAFNVLYDGTLYRLDVAAGEESDVPQD